MINDKRNNTENVEWNSMNEFPDLPGCYLVAVTKDGYSYVMPGYWSGLEWWYDWKKSESFEERRYDMKAWIEYPNYFGENQINSDNR